MGRQKRNASRIQAFRAFSPHGHAVPCWIRALQLWLSASSLPHARLSPSSVLPARRKKIVAQGRGMSQQGGYFRNINTSFN